MLTEQEQQEQAEKLAAAEARALKAEEERENYKKGLLLREDELKELKSKKDEDLSDKKKADEDTEWDENSKKFQQETLSKTEKIAELAAVKAIEQRNDKTAQQEFRESHPEIDDEKWEKIVSNYNPKNGKDSMKGIIKDLERAFVLVKFDAGETIDPAEILRNDAINRNKEMNINHGASQNSGKFEEEKGGVTEGQKSLGQRFGITPDKLEKEDDSLNAVIHIV